MLIDKIYVNSAGDPDVGIFPAYITINMDGTLDTDVFAEEDVQDALNHYRERIRECFSEILDDRVFVEYDFELRRRDEELEEALRGEPESEVEEV